MPAIDRDTTLLAFCPDCGGAATCAAYRSARPREGGAARMTGLDHRATAIAEAVSAAWWGARGGNLIEIPLGVVAALSLVRQADQNGPKPAEIVATIDEDGLVALLRQIWLRFTIARPELSIRIGPFVEWLNDAAPAQAAGAHAAALAAVKAGLLDIADEPDRLQEVDLLGRVCTVLRAEGGRKANAEYHTPTCVADLMAAMSLGVTPGRKPSFRPGQSIADPAAGSGNLLRAAATHLRRHGINPGDVWWVANDIDPVAVAALAVNAHLWGLGAHVVIGVADTLAEPDWHVRAKKEQWAAIEAHNEHVRVARMIAAVRDFQQFMEEAEGAPEAAGNAA